MTVQRVPVEIGFTRSLLREKLTRRAPISRLVPLSLAVVIVYTI